MEDFDIQAGGKGMSLEEILAAYYDIHPTFVQHERVIDALNKRINELEKELSKRNTK